MKKTMQELEMSIVECEDKRAELIAINSDLVDACQAIIEDSKISDVYNDELLSNLKQVIEKAGG